MALHNEYLVMSPREFTHEFGELAKGDSMTYYFGQGLALCNDTSNAADKLRRHTRKLHDDGRAVLFQKIYGDGFDYMIKKL